jgi:hypothetical protein
MIIRGIYRQVKYNRTIVRKPEKEFEFCKIILGTIFLCGLTWLFGFLVIIPSSDNMIYLGFIFAFIFCILNAFQGVFIYSSIILIKRLELKHLVKTNRNKNYIHDVDIPLSNINDNVN